MNHYERLGVDRDVTPTELRRAYRQLASRHHPDRNGDDVDGATQKMVEINEAFDVLSNPVKRFDYNRSLDRSPRRGTKQDSANGNPRQSQPSGQSRSAPPPADDPVRRARREAKEREAAKAKERGYRSPGPFGGMDFSAPK